MLGFYGMLFELQNPGAILPGVVGGICLILAFLRPRRCRSTWPGSLLIVLALVFFVAEVKVRATACSRWAAWCRSCSAR